MFKVALKLGTIITAFSSPLLKSQSFQQLLPTAKRVLFLPSFRQTTSLKFESPSLLYLYNQTDLEKPNKLQQVLSNSKQYGYQLFKMFINETNQDQIVQNIQITPQQNQLRKQYDAHIYYLDQEKLFKLPIGTPRSEIDSWVAKCQQPSFLVPGPRQFYTFCRRFLQDDNNFVLIGYKLSPNQKSNLEKYSRYHYKIPVLIASDQLAERLGLIQGVSIVRQVSEYDGDFGVQNAGLLKILNMEQKEFEPEELEKWVQENNQPLVVHCDSFSKIHPMFTRIYKSSRRCLYVLTSQMNVHSQNYQKLVKRLCNIADKKEVVIAIVSDDEIAKKLGLIRTKDFRRMAVPQFRFVDFNYLVSTQPDQEDNFPIVNCDQANCADLTDTHYTRKFSLKEFSLPEGTLENFVQNSLQGQLQQYYQKQNSPSIYAKKICNRNFRQQIFQTKKDVVLELYGKYCPACNFFKEKYDKIAKDMNSQKLSVVKMCVDYNRVQQVKQMKSYTPIFWYYKAGDKENPIQYQGRLDQNQLRQFISDKLTESSIDNNQ